MPLQGDWRHGADHMWDRHKVKVSDADETLDDVDAVWFDPDPKSRTDRSIRVIGYCTSRRELLTVIYRCGNRTVVTVTGRVQGEDSTATVYQVVDGQADRRYEFQTGSNAMMASGVGERCTGVADQGPGPTRP